MRTAQAPARAAWSRGTLTTRAGQGAGCLTARRAALTPACWSASAASLAPGPRCCPPPRLTQTLALRLPHLRGLRANMPHTAVLVPAAALNLRHLALCSATASAPYTICVHWHFHPRSFFFFFLPQLSTCCSKSQAELKLARGSSHAGHAAGPGAPTDPCSCFSPSSPLPRVSLGPSIACIACSWGCLIDNCGPPMAGCWEVWQVSESVQVSGSVQRDSLWY